MSNIFAESGDILEDITGKTAFKIVNPIEAKAKRKRDEATKKERARLAAFQKSQEPPESVKTIREDAAAAKRRKGRSLQGTGRQSTILTGVQTALKARLGQ